MVRGFERRYDFFKSESGGGSIRSYDKLDNEKDSLSFTRLMKGGWSFAQFREHAVLFSQAYEFAIEPMELHMFGFGFMVPEYTGALAKYENGLYRVDIDGKDVSFRLNNQRPRAFHTVSQIPNGTGHIILLLIK